MIHDDVILFGDLKVNDGIAKLSNPNFAVFLNLAWHDSGNERSELVTLVIEPVETGKLSFHTSDAEGKGNRLYKREKEGPVQ